MDKIFLYELKGGRCGFYNEEYIHEADTLDGIERCAIVELGETEKLEMRVTTIDRLQDIIKDKLDSIEYGKKSNKSFDRQYTSLI